MGTVIRLSGESLKPQADDARKLIVEKHIRKRKPVSIEWVFTTSKAVPRSTSVRKTLFGRGSLETKDGRTFTNKGTPVDVPLDFTVSGQKFGVSVFFQRDLRLKAAVAADGAVRLEFVPPLPFTFVSKPAVFTAIADQQLLGVYVVGPDKIRYELSAKADPAKTVTVELLLEIPKSAVAGAGLFGFEGICPGDKWGVYRDTSAHWCKVQLETARPIAGELQGPLFDTKEEATAHFDRLCADGTCKNKNP